MNCNLRECSLILRNRAIAQSAGLAPLFRALSLGLAPQALCLRPLRGLFVIAPLPLLEIPAGEIDKRGPVWTGRVSAAVLSPGNVAINQRGFDRWKCVSAEISSADQPVYRPRRNRCHEHPPLIYPLAFDFRRPGAEENRTRRTECDQFMRVHGQIIRGERAAYFRKFPAIQ